MGNFAFWYCYEPNPKGFGERGVLAISRRISVHRTSLELTQNLISNVFATLGNENTKWYALTPGQNVALRNYLGRKPITFKDILPHLSNH